MFAYWDADQVCRFANKAYTEWFGKTPEDLINKMTLKQLLGKELFNKNLPYIEKVLQGETQVFNRDIVLPGGEIRHAIATYLPDIEGDTVRGFFVHVADIENADIEQFSDKKISLKSSNIFYPTNQSADLYIHKQINSDKAMAEVAAFLKTQIFSTFPGLSTIAKKHLVSVSKLKRDFKAAFNVTPLVYYRNLQMNFAAQHSKEKKITKKELASLLSFSNPSNFSTYFKRFTNDENKRKQHEQIVHESHELNKIFIAQTPFAIAMFDNSMNYLAISEEWIQNFRLEDKQIIGKNHYDVFPEITDELKAMNSACLKGAIHQCDAYPFKRADGSIQWLKWDKRPWYTADKTIGGLLIYSQDITNIKLREDAAKRNSDILNRTSELGKIGTWERNLITGKVNWNKVTKEILELDEVIQAPWTESIQFYKAGKSRAMVKAATEEAIRSGKPFDLEVEIITAKNNLKQVRVIGQAEFIEGKASVLFGIFLEI